MMLLNNQSRGVNDFSTFNLNIFTSIYLGQSGQKGQNNLFVLALIYGNKLGQKDKGNYFYSNCPFALIVPEGGFSNGTA